MTGYRVKVLALRPDVVAALAAPAQASAFAHVVFGVAHIGDGSCSVRLCTDAPLDERGECLGHLEMLVPSEPRLSVGENVEIKAGAVAMLRCTIMSRARGEER